MSSKVNGGISIADEKGRMEMPPEYSVSTNNSKIKESDKHLPAGEALEAIVNGNIVIAYKAKDGNIIVKGGEDLTVEQLKEIKEAVAARIAEKEEKKEISAGFDMVD